jgi:hypothetical protein
VFCVLEHFVREYGKQNRVGTILTVRSTGKRWKKVRRLSPQEYEKAMDKADFDMHMGIVSAETLEGLGFELIPDSESDGKTLKRRKHVPAGTRKR